jgi:hypothetical protein
MSISKSLANKYIVIKEDESLYYLTSFLRLIISRKIPASF